MLSFFRPEPKKGTVLTRTQDIALQKFLPSCSSQKTPELGSSNLIHTSSLNTLNYLLPTIHSHDFHTIYHYHIQSSLLSLCLYLSNPCSFSNSSSSCHSKLYMHQSHHHEFRIAICRICVLSSQASSLFLVILSHPFYLCLSQLEIGCSLFIVLFI